MRSPAHGQSSSRSPTSNRLVIGSQSTHPWPTSSRMVGEQQAQRQRFQSAGGDAVLRWFRRPDRPTALAAVTEASAKPRPPRRRTNRNQTGRGGRVTRHKTVPGLYCEGRRGRELLQLARPDAGLESTSPAARAVSRESGSAAFSATSSPVRRCSRS